MMAAIWSDLPLDILILFAERLPCAEDFVRFGAVCKSWRDAANDVKEKGRRFNPWMMLSKSENDDAADAGGVRTFCDVSTSKFYDIRLPQLQGRRCWGTHYGWLIVFGVYDKDIFLFHPLTQAKICLPSQLDWTCVPQTYIKKIAVSSDPSDRSIRPTVMASFGTYRRPAFASPGDDTWLTMTTTSNADIIYFKGYFYSVDPIGKLSVFSVKANVPRTLEIAPPPSPKMCDKTGKFYLVEISTSLYLFNRSYDHSDVEECADEDFDPFKLNVITLCFYAFKMNFRKRKWIFCEDLQGYAVFLGNNQSFAISPTEYPHFKPNFVYFTDDYDEVMKTDYVDMGIYDYENDTIIKSFDNCVRRGPSELSGPALFMPQLS